MAGEAFFGHGSDDEARGIPADLVPYLEAADAPDEGADQAEEPNAAAAADDSARDAALRALVENSLLVGPDPTILAEITGDFDEAFADDTDSADDADWSDDADSAPGADDSARASRTASGARGSASGAHDAALAAAADQVELDAQMRRIYESIVERAPEHDFDPTLDRVKTVLDILGDPQNAYPSVHVTGTNGKTSTARMIDAVLMAFGMKVGRFTSPHLIDVRERISLEGHPISREGFIAAWQDVEPYIRMVDERSQEQGGPRLSFFEVFTVMAFAAFADYPVDAAVVEVGMGGTWDSTNVIGAGVSVVTPIGVDHTRWLGSTVEQIAHEKAGVIKPGQIVVVARQSEEAMAVLEERARQVDAVLRVEGRDFEVVDRQMGVGGQLVTVRTPAAVYEDVFVPLLGEHQAHNAAVALAAVEAFMGGRALDGRIVESGMMAVSSPGRLQVVRRSPTIIVDAAHNPAGASTLRDALEESFGFSRVVGVYSAMGDKDVEGVLSEVEPFMEHIVVTRMDGGRAADIEALARVAADVFGPDRVDAVEGLADAVDRAAALAEAGAGPSDRSGVLVFGSVHLAGDMLALAGKLPE